MNACPYCRLWAGKLADLVRESRGRRFPPTEHGHRLWLVTTSSNVYLFAAPDRADLDAVVRRAQRSRQEPRFRARLATTATLRSLAAAGDRPARTW